MIVLGVGSNLGDPIDNVRKAINALKSNQNINLKYVSPLYVSDALLPDNAQKDWNKSYVNGAIACDSNLSPNEMLAEIKKIEKSLGRGAAAHWAPRIIDIDILAWSGINIETKELTIPHTELHNRPFALWPLLDLFPEWQHPKVKLDAIIKCWGDRYSGSAPFATRQIQQRADTPSLVGILNITPDSFSDGGNFSLAENAIKRAEKLFLDGAYIIDIGAESTHPSNKPISHEEEWNRLYPVLSELDKWRKSLPIAPKFSIDSYHSENIEKSLAFGVEFINDVSGGEDEKIVDIVSKSGLPYVLMYPRDLAKDFTGEDVVIEVKSWFENKLVDLQKKGVAADQVIIDPAFGYWNIWGKSFAIIRRLEELKDLGLPIFISHSRKGSLQHFRTASPQDRDIETAGLSIAVSKNVDYLRLHNVELHSRLFKTLGSVDNSSYSYKSR